MSLLATMGLAHALRAGQLLIEAKEMVGHGEWLPWVEKNCDFTGRTAQMYMRVAERFPELANTKHVSHLNFRDALKLLAAPDDDNVHFSSESAEWYTPPEIVARTVELLGGIDLDPCSDAGSNVPAAAWFMKEDDGLMAALA